MESVGVRIIEVVDGSGGVLSCFNVCCRKCFLNMAIKKKIRSCHESLNHAMLGMAE